MIINTDKLEKHNLNYCIYYHRKTECYRIYVDKKDLNLMTSTSRGSKKCKQDINDLIEIVVDEELKKDISDGWK